MTEAGSHIPRPDGRFDDPVELGRVLEGRVLPMVSRPARYIGGEVGAEPAEHWRPDGVNTLLCFPDAYEVGMSHTGLRILYTLLNGRPDSYCDLAFAPWPDMEQSMRGEGMPLYGLITRRPARAFDIIGFSLGYELAYTNLLTMLDLAGLPLRADQRRDGDPLVVAGGGCVMNPAVIGPFCDVVLPGDGEEILGEVVGVVAACRAEGQSREETLARVRALPGVWWQHTPEPVRASVVADLNTVPLPRPLVPVTEPVHDRLAVEVMRGCARGCRFCQAGMIQRPVRERDVDAVVRAARDDTGDTGLDEIGLLSLSTSDYTQLGAAVTGIQDSLEGSRTNLVLPSLRMDSVDAELHARIGRERPSSVTFAPEAGSQRLRDVINKQIGEDEILDAARQAFKSGVKRVKLYFMIGLPTETNDDLDGLVALVGRMIGLAPRGGSQVTVSVSPFAPKAHTPFQWAGQIPRAEIERRNQYLARRLRRLGAKVSLREPDVSFLEGVLGLGDAALADVVETAWRDGARFDGWDEQFDFALWARAFEACGVDADVLVAAREEDAPLPWDSVLGPVDREFLQREWALALAGELTPDCRLEGPCTACAACDGPLQHIAASPASPASPAPVAAGASAAAPAAGPAADEPPEDPRWRFWRERASAKIWCRLEFAKAGRLVFLGHLDFQRLLHMALRRSGLPVAYSKGYHPHPLVKYGPPLPVGVAGEREVLDLAMQWVEPGWQERLAAAMPDDLTLVRGIVVGSITPPSIENRAERLDYRIVLPAPDAGGPDAAAAEDAVTGFLAAGTWPWTRHRPGKPDVNVDARRLVRPEGLRWTTRPEGSEPGVLHLSLVREAGGAGLPVHEFLAALFGASLPEPRWCAVTRTGMLGCDEMGRWLSPFAEIESAHRRTWLQAHMNS
jgi:radical SAM family uncharacterized protein/radical SAM-linked protein